MKAHGIKGEVVVDFTSERPERRAPGAVLQTSGGPLTVEQAVPFQNRWRVRFAGIADRNAAERLRGTVLRAEALPDDDSGALWVHELIGSTVTDTTGAVVGVVEAVEANPASDLLVLDGGRLVPVVFVVSSAAGLVVIDPPVGLLDDADADADDADGAADTGAADADTGAADADAADADGAADTDGTGGRPARER